MLCIEENINTKNKHAVSERIRSDNPLCVFVSLPFLFCFLPSIAFDPPCCLFADYFLFCFSCLVAIRSYLYIYIFILSLSPCCYRFRDRKASVT